MDPWTDAGEDLADKEVVPFYMGIYSDFMGFCIELMGFDSDFMGFYSDSWEIIVFYSERDLFWSSNGIW